MILAILADPPNYLWHLFQQGDSHAVGRIGANSETKRGKRVRSRRIRAPDGGGGFVSIASNSLSNRYNFLGEAEDLSHR